MGLKSTTPVPSFAEVTDVKRLDSHTYRINLNEAFCTGAGMMNLKPPSPCLSNTWHCTPHSLNLFNVPVPNGGYTASCMLAAASLHLKSRGQPDTLTAHVEYPGRTEAGPAIVVIDDVKLGKQLSTLHLTLWQGGLLSSPPWITPSVSRRTVLAYTTRMDQQSFTGMTMPTAFEASPAAKFPPLPDFAKLKAEGVDDGWEESRLPEFAAAVQRSLGNWRFFMPRGEPLVPGYVDIWMCRANGERITQRVIPYVVDAFPFNLHSFTMDPELRKLLEVEGAPEKKEAARPGDAHGARGRASLWFPTVVMNLEVKMALPEDGVEWLASRITSKQMKDGKFDLDVQVRDLDGDLVALSHHVAMILEIERNTSKRKGSTKAAL